MNPPSATSLVADAREEERAGGGRGQQRQRVLDALDDPGAAEQPSGEVGNGIGPAVLGDEPIESADDARMGPWLEAVAIVKVSAGEKPDASPGGEHVAAVRGCCPGGVPADRFVERVDHE